MRDSNDWIFSSSAAADQGVAMDFAGVLGMETGGTSSRDCDSQSNAGACMRLRTTPVDFDSALEPMTRCRANTWPCRPNDSVVDEENRSTPTSVDGDQSEGVGCRDPSLGGGVVGPCGGAGTRKAAARRNAWGNLSYADLITRAIESSPEKRLTLSQIYSWMVENVPFFKDKGDSNSSAGWKNSIRHNLSLHSRFMRVQNESTGKSSWWVINPDVKTLKTPRRRAATMDNTKVALQHRRNRLKGGGLTRVSSSDRSLMGYAYDGSPDHHMDASNLDPDMLGIGSQSYRVRSSSNASSIGRLSPILATAEHDAEETQFRMSLPSSSSTLQSPWNGLCLPQSESCAETLSESLASIFVEDPKKSNMGGEQCHGNVMAQNGSVMTPNRAGIMAQNGGGVMGQNAGNAMSTGGALGQNRNVMGQNGAPMMGGMPPYPHNTVGMEGRAGGGHLAMGHHHMWSVYRNQQPGNVFPSPPIPGDVGNKMGVRYNGDSGGYAMRHMVSRPNMGFYEESRGPRYGQFGVGGIGGTGPQYGNPALSELLKQEHKPTSCYFAGSNGDPGVGMTSPLTSCVKSEHPSMAVFPGERQGMAQWPDQQQQQQQQSPRQLSLGSPLGPIDPRKLMKILAEKPHLKEKMLQLIQQKRQQLTLQQHHQHQLNPVSHPGSTPPSYLNATKSMLRIPEIGNPKREPSSQDAAGDPPKTLPTASCRSGQESSMPVDLDLDFETNPVINCDIDQVIQHELTFGELDFSLDQLQVTVSSSSMDFSNGFRF